MSHAITNEVEIEADLGEVERILKLLKPEVEVAVDTAGQSESVRHINLMHAAERAEQLSAVAAKLSRHLAYLGGYLGGAGVK